MKAKFNFPREIVTTKQRYDFPVGEHDVPEEVAEHAYFEALVKAGDVTVIGKTKAEKAKGKGKEKEDEEDENNDEGGEAIKLPKAYKDLLVLAEQKGMDVSNKPPKAEVVKYLEEKLAEEANADLA